MSRMIGRLALCVLLLSNLGMAVAEDGSLTQLRGLAEQGDAEAQYHLGGEYALGREVPKDNFEAVKWYRKAAEQGHAMAQYVLGQRYDLGKGVPENDIEAVKWYREAAVQGLTSAQYALGLMYADGAGVPEDSVQAYAWFNIAAAQAQGGSYAAEKEKANLTELMTREDITRAQELSREYWGKYVLPFRN